MNEQINAIAHLLSTSCPAPVIAGIMNSLLYVEDDLNRYTDEQAKMALVLLGTLIALRPDAEELARNS